MAYEVIFEAGSLKGRRWPIPEGGMLTIGRSHSCGVRPKEPDVSGKHAVLREEGGVVWLEVLSSHKTAVDGIRLPAGEKVAITEVSQVALGGSLAFRLKKFAASEGETGEVMPADTGTLGGTGTMATAATRAMPAGVAAPGPDTAAIGPDTGTLGGTGTIATAATRAMPAGVSAPGPDTATIGIEPAGGPGRGPDTATLAPDGETQIVTGLTPPPSTQGDTALASGDSQDDGGETQVLATQMASREELEKLKAAYERKKTRKTAKKTVFLGILVAVAAGVSIWFSTREPEKILTMAGDRGSTRLVPELLPTRQSAPSGFIGISLPKSGTKILKNGEGVLEAVVPVGKKGDVLVNVVFEAYSDPAALREARSRTFDRYLERTEAMLPALDEMAPLPEEDFFGGRKGIRRGIPCSRREYWCGRMGKSVYGVISFFRCGTLCFAFRREVAAFERARAANLLLPTEAWLYADSAGEFAARQWEGAEGAGTVSPAVVVARCEERLRVDSTADWQMIETGLRNVLVVLDGKAEDAPLRDRALGLLGELRKVKASHWQKLAARRAKLPDQDARQTAATKAEADEIDALVRKDFGNPEEEWYFLARSRGWWR